MSQVWEELTHSDFGLELLFNVMSNMNMKKVVIIVILLVIGMTGCDCPEFNSGANVNPSVREATVTEFNPTTLPDSSPVPSYSIANFRFPTSTSSSGDLPTDTRVSNGRFFILAERTFPSNNRTYTALRTTQSLPNDSLIGDMQVVSVNIPPVPGQARTAVIRFWGGLANIGKTFNSASATDFVNYLRGFLNPPAPDPNANWPSNWDSDATANKGGAVVSGVNQSSVLPPFTDIVLDENGNNVTGIVSIPPTLFDDVTLGYRDITVTIGDVYYYTARNGSKFAILIEDISFGSLAPNLNRVTIKFADLNGPTCLPE